VDVDFLLEEDQDVDGLRFIHTPGHCPGQVCILLGDVVLSADHVLSRTTPHQAPESITAYTGLGHYLESLEKLRQVPGFDLALGGHEEPIPDVYKRIDQIRVSHLRKLDKVLTVIKSAKQPATIHETAKAMYPKVDGFHQLLAMEEVGAHVEHLYQRGELAACNLEELESEDHPAIRYRPT
jgi:glyoxylase-like metal-dependent hydrolase (beta-lactamase superfamily II)